MEYSCRKILGALALFTAALPTTILAQPYPSKPVRVVVPASPGGGQDFLIRLISPGLNEALGQSIVVENRAGANGIVGAEHVARSGADGYTLMLTGPSTFAAAMVQKSVPFTLQDFVPVTIAVEPVSVLVVNGALPVASLRELIEYSKRNPNKLHYGSSGIASSIHLMAEMLKSQSGLDMTHVPYKGVGPAMADLAAGHIGVSISSAATALPFARAGKLKILAVTLGARYRVLPDIATVAETVPAFRKPPTWFSFFAPAGIAPPVLARAHGALVRALTNPELRPKFDQEGLLVIANTPEEFATALKLDMETHFKAMAVAGIKPE
ncbi:MAG: tripartite tricarboxylate transporter substrate binding protein [Betaproteobacteria bacterium]|nr:tripartite tricarboxylate transporter substrate binding protein [Betaproteobacteria bacterium]